ncbi:MAG: hypothetical protein QOJ50_1906 [Cryptosporangiaceae bacterium]|nr:hypothetical protein [Cryptosporangiaceae bacterium]
MATCPARPDSTPVPTHAGGSWPVMSAIRVGTLSDPAEFAVIADRGAEYGQHRYATLTVNVWPGGLAVARDGDYDLTWADAQTSLLELAELGPQPAPTSYPFAPAGGQRCFTLGESAAATWLTAVLDSRDTSGACQTALAEHSPAPGLPEEFTAGWNPKWCGENLAAASALIAAAQHGPEPVLAAPAGARVTLDWRDEADAGSYRYLLHLDSPGGPEITLAGSPEPLAIPAADDAAGVSAGISLLQDATAAANHLLDGFRAFLAGRPGGQRGGGPACHDCGTTLRSGQGVVVFRALSPTELVPVHNPDGSYALRCLNCATTPVPVKRRAAAHRYEPDGTAPGT